MRLNKVIAYIVLFFSFLLIADLKVHAQNTGFTGVWILNEKQSEFGRFSLSVLPDTVIINLQNDSIRISRLGANDFAIIYPINGGVVDRVMPNDKKRTASVKFDKTGKIFIESSTTKSVGNGNLPPTKTTYEWGLSSSRNMLICNIEFVSQGAGTYTAKVQYDRQ